MRTLRKIMKWGMALGLLAVLCLIGANMYVRHTTTAICFQQKEDLPKSKVGIVFGAGLTAANTPNKYLKDRLDAGIALIRDGKVDKLLLSGDNGRDEYDEVTVMKHYCAAQGVDTAKIYLDYAGFDTYSTMYRAKHIFLIDTAILVTQKYHLPRAVFLGNQLGVKSVGYVANKGMYLAMRRYKAREYLAIVKASLDLLRGRLPRFLGNIVSIDGKSNYSKADDFSKK